MSTTTGTITTTDERADDRDRELVARRMAAYDENEGPRNGDFVLFADGERRRFCHDHGEHGLQTYTGGSYHLGDHGLSYSGSLDPCIPRDTLTYDEQTSGAVWIFHHNLPGAGRGVSFYVPFRVFTCSLNRREAEQLQRERTKVLSEKRELEQAKAIAARKPVTPDQLAEAFCGEQFQSLRSASSGWVDGEDQESGAKYRMARGHCGYNGVRGTDDALLTGFDDGYEFMGYLSEGRGWVSLAEKGDWPYVVWLVYKAGLKGGVFAACEYVEGDFTVWTFPTKDALKAFMAKVPDAN